MKLSSRSKEYIVPEYSLTGDLLSFLTCNLQYRYQNKGTLPPSMPIQLWFGEFIHGIMEESFLKWENNKKNTNSNLNFPWDWKKDIRPIEEMIDKRLQARGLYPPIDYYCSHNEVSENSYACADGNHPHKLLYSARAEAAINIWGPHLFPLIDSAEVLIKGMRDMPNYESGKSRSNYYAINGVIDVLSSLKIDNTFSNKEEDKNNSFQKTLDSYNPSNLKSTGLNKNKILEYLSKNQEFKDCIKTLNTEEYEIIIDYKGMKRPSLNSENWKHHSWQILTYSWLRSMQEDAKPIVAGIIFYLNELVPSTEDIIAIQEDIQNENTDVKVSPNDLEKILEWDETQDFPYLSDKFKMDRSIRIINIKDELIESALNEFDSVVNEIETATIKEIDGTPIKQSWKAEADDRTCDACDFKSFCNNNKHKTKDMTIP